MVVYKKQLEIPLMTGLWEPETCRVNKGHKFLTKYTVVSVGNLIAKSTYRFLTPCKIAFDNDINENVVLASHVTTESIFLQ